MSAERDYVLARVAIALNTVNEATEAMHAAVSHFVVPEEDVEGEARREALEEAEHGLRVAIEQIQSATEGLLHLDADGLTQGELDDEEDEAWDEETDTVLDDEVLEDVRRDEMKEVEDEIEAEEEGVYDDDDDDTSSNGPGRAA